ncbi:hypothetical protein H113_05996 [Trichophyton rubrum MR1459]|uniref:Uncharacterized protein n=1 Tax=Trichophyton rubrum (strain ATCC MYA-4607 / CBS 118892) TaxID=559305 RepID=A0A080WG25_TRIRC|nr:uncharacterized protein TERG_12033 [Trichophyton rubrum CBS 118892]EZF93248.1 hypothetical protein H113_05996 [Trichophyton rubrum MR1459]EZG04110.1 hypothetical protein H106_05792 [Trichophyton rubrum CBS 735.88]KFL61291.1 hypothetical protein TERG_12033 [Trichophyton rubrum CBS 118892]
MGPPHPHHRTGSRYQTKTHPQRHQSLHQDPPPPHFQALTCSVLHPKLEARGKPVHHPCQFGASQRLSLYRRPAPVSEGYIAAGRQLCQVHRSLRLRLVQRFLPGALLWR